MGAPSQAFCAYFAAIAGVASGLAGARFAVADGLTDAVGAAGVEDAFADGVGVALGVAEAVAFGVAVTEGVAVGLGVGAAWARPGIDSARAATVSPTADETTGFMVFLHSVSCGVGRCPGPCGQDSNTPYVAHGRLEKS
ncbi:hypothetical protein GCM10028815_29000 [Mariniluteicoccus flavus]